MSLAIGGSHIPSVDEWLAPGINARSVIDATSFPRLQARNESTTKNNTVNMFIDGMYDDLEYAASVVSVVSACPPKTVYAIRCTGAPRSRLIGTSTCGPNGVIVTITSNPTQYEISSSIYTNTLGVDAQATLQETCKLAGTTAATCTATANIKGGGRSISSTVTTTATGTDYYRFDVAITGGAEKLTNPTGACSSSAAIMINPKSIALWALAGFISVGGMLAM